MSQDQILKALESNDLTIKEMHELLDISLRRIQTAVHQMIKYNEIARKEGKPPTYSIKKK